MSPKKNRKWVSNFSPNYSITFSLAYIQTHPRIFASPFYMEVSCFQALSQCEATLSKLGVVRESVDDTAGAAQVSWRMTLFTFHFFFLIVSSVYWEPKYGMTILRGSSGTTYWRCSGKDLTWISYGPVSHRLRDDSHDFNIIQIWNKRFFSVDLQEPNPLVLIVSYLSYWCLLHLWWVLPIPFPLTLQVSDPQSGVFLIMYDTQNASK